MSFVIGLQCKECGRNYPKEPRHDAWAFVNVNLHPYYSEGAKTHGFEVAEQLRWRLPRHIVVASAGGMILPKLAKSFKELVKVGLVEDTGYEIYSAQAAWLRPDHRAQTEGIFTEPAGGTEVAVAKKLIQSGKIPREESIVISITGNGYKTLEAVAGSVAKPWTIPATLESFDELYQQLDPPATAKAASG